MITAVITFQLPEPTSLEKLSSTFESTAPNYLGMAGLVRKYYVASEDGKTAGGVYLWETIDAAKAVYTDEWRAMIKGKYGAEPTVTFFNTPVVVDNLANEIVRS